MKLLQWLLGRSAKVTRYRRRRELGMEALEGRALMAMDLTVNTRQLPGGDVLPGDDGVVAAEFTMSSGRGGLAMPRTMTFAPTMQNGGAVTTPVLNADMYRFDRGRRLLGQDGVYETQIATGTVGRDGSVSFPIFPSGALLALRSTPLQFQFDVSGGAVAGTHIAFNPPTFMFYPLMRSNVIYTGGDNPVYVVDGGPELHVAERSGPTTDEAVSSEHGIVLARGSLFAQDGSVNVTGVTFVTMEGNSVNIAQADLLVDTDGVNGVDTIVASAFPSNGHFVFDTNVSIGEGVIHDYEVRASVASSLASDRTLRIGLQSVLAENPSDGADLPAANLHMQTTPQTLWTFVQNGSLVVTQSTTPSRPQYLLGGTQSDYPVAEYDVRASDESVLVTDFALFVPGSGGSSVEDFIIKANGVPIARATIAGAGSDPIPDGGMTFWARMFNAELRVPEGESVRLSVYARTKSDVNGGISGATVRPDLVTTVDFVSVQAVGETSSNRLNRDDGDADQNEGEVVIGTGGVILGTEHTVVMSKITSVVNANPDADGSAVPVGVSPFAQFKFTAGAHNNTRNGLNKVVLDAMMFTVNATNVIMDASGFQFYNKADATSKVMATALAMDGVTPLTGNVTGTFLVSVTGLSTSAVYAELDSGASVTLVLEGKIANPQVSGALPSRLQGTLETDHFFTMFDRDNGSSILLSDARLPEGQTSSTQYSS